MGFGCLEEVLLIFGCISFEFLVKDVVFVKEMN